jgi:DNA-binding transcriptional ArsR family regulator
MNSLESEHQTAAVLAALLAAISNPKRLAVLDALRDGEKSVGALAIEVGLSQSALSQHLTIMRQQGLLTGRKQSQSVFYSIRPDAGMLLITGLHAMLDQHSENVAQALSIPDALTAPIETIDPVPTAFGAP